MKGHPFGVAMGFLMAGASAAVAATFDLTSATFWGDHGIAVLFFGLDVLAFAAIAAVSYSQVLINRAHERAFADLSQRVGKIEGIAHERGDRIRTLIGLINVLRERTIILRDCDEEHEKRIMKVEDRLQMAREKAVARLALRGMAFDDGALKDPTPKE